MSTADLNFTEITTIFTTREVLKKLTFSWTDYSLFGIMLGLSGMIGIYFGCFGKKQNTTSEYLLGGKTMSIFPISMSLIASHISGITLLGLPAEVYMHGTQYWVCFISLVLLSLAVCYVYLPVFYTLQLTSCYEYLKLRFNTRVRLLASGLYAISVILHIPIWVYIPALAFNQVTGASIHVITPIVCTVCIFYTTLGGLKAVVWTDTIQYICTLGALFVVFCLGLHAAGGLAPVWETADQSGRIEFFNMDLDPTTRNTFWAITVGMTCTWINHLGINQGCVQRFLAVPSVREARQAMIIFCLGNFITKSISCLTGLIMYSKYKDCDPWTTKEISRSDQILPYYVMEVAGNIPGLPGLFVAGVFSAALSTMSAGLNTLAGSVYEDFISRFMPANTTEKRASDIMKLIVVIAGFLCLALVYIVERLGAVLQLALSLGAVTAGPLLGLFTLGMLFPSANAKGAFYGGLGSLFVTSWLVFGGQYYKAIGKLTVATMPLSVDGCGFNETILNQYTTTTSPPIEDQAPYIYRISFYYYSLIGAIALFLIALPVSWITSDGTETVHPDLISPVMHWRLPKRKDLPHPSEYKKVAVELLKQNGNADKEHHDSE